MTAFNPIPGRKVIEVWITGRTVSTDALVAELEEWADYWRTECGRPARPPADLSGVENA